jgi:hypothetical protein
MADREKKKLDSERSRASEIRNITESKIDNKQ